MNAAQLQRAREWRKINYYGKPCELMDECLAAFAASETAKLTELQADAFETQRQQIEAFKSDRAAAEAERDRAVRAVREIEELVKNTNEDSCTNADDHAVCMDRCLDAIEGVYEAALSPVPVPVPIKINCYVKGHPGGSDCPICRSNFDDEEAGPALKGETQK